MQFFHFQRVKNNFHLIFIGDKFFLLCFTPETYLNFNVMKRFPQINRFFTAVCSIVIISLSFQSCEREAFEDDSALFIDQNSISARGGINQSLDPQLAVLLDENSDLLAYTDCSSNCIEPESGVYYYVSDSQSGSSGPNTKEISYLAYNTETEFVVDVVYNITSGNSNANAEITITIDGTSKLFSGIAPGSRVSHSLPLDATWTACESVVFSIYQESLGSPIEFNNNYALVGACRDGCDESFEYKLNQDGSYTFTYISEEDIVNADVKLTCPHIVSFEALDGKTYSVNLGNGNGAPTVLTWNGDINACEEITFTIAFEADCDQNNAGFATLWTDFNVNDISKKEDLDNITFDCE